MIYIIDGHNLIPKIPGLHLRDMDDEIKLIKLLQDFSRNHRKKVEVYFDNAPVGVPEKRNFGLVKAYFVRQGKTADHAIETRLIKLGKRANECIVVSSDRQVQAAARSNRAQLLSADEFARKFFNPDGELPRKEKPEGVLDEDELRAWLELFGEE